MGCGWCAGKNLPEACPRCKGYDFYDDDGNRDHAETRRAFDAGEYELILEHFCHEGVYVADKAPWRKDGLVETGICSQSIWHEDTPEAARAALKELCERLINAKAEGC